jgi:hypothetical protein
MFKKISLSWNQVQFVQTLSPIIRQHLKVETLQEKLSELREQWNDTVMYRCQVFPLMVKKFKKLNK